MKQPRYMKTVAVVATLVALAIVANTSTATIDICNTYNINGTGSLTRDVTINTNIGNHGQKFSMTTVTPEVKFAGMSELNYTEDIFVGASNMSNTSDIMVSGTVSNMYVEQTQCQRNYEMGVSQYYKWEGNTSVDYDWMADNLATAMALVGHTDGKMRYSIVVKDMKDHHVRIYDEDFRFCGGRLDYDINSVIENTTYPGNMSDDWLPCPWG